ncbi:MAG: hypothetical protein KA712_11940 [Myxococcales bacterium]|nr:hypothetical protein [Myxococcales bacterium]
MPRISGLVSTVVVCFGLGACSGGSTPDDDATGEGGASAGGAGGEARQGGAGGGGGTGGKAAGAAGAGAGGARSGGAGGAAGAPGAGGASTGGGSPGSGWEGSWPKRRAYQVNLEGKEGLSDLPLLVAVPAEDAPSAQAVRFVSAAGTLLPHEFDAVAGPHALVWVRVPRPEEPFWLYFGKDGAENLPAGHARAVWGEDMVVWHLQDSGKESSAAAFDTQAEGTPFGAGRIGRGYVGQSAQGTNLGISREDGVNRKLLPGATAFTVSAWVRPSAFSQLGDKPFARQILSVGTPKSDSNLNHAAAFLGLGLDRPGEGGGQVVVGARPQGDEETAGSAQKVPKETWTHVAGIVNLATKRGRLFIDGLPVSDWIDMGDLEATVFSSDHEAKSLHIGASSGGSYGHFDGGIDEVRLERTLRSDAFMKAVYENMVDPVATVAAGPVQTKP